MENKSQLHHTPPPPPGAKIHLNRVPKFKRKATNNGKQQQKCPICALYIPLDQLRQHLKIELLDPKWREQRQKAEQKLQGSNLMYDQGASIVENLKKMAEFRTDIFGGEVVDVAKKLKEKAAIVQKDAVMWDGHTATVPLVINKASKNLTIDEQIDAIHQSKGLVPKTSKQIGPSMKN